MYRRILAAAVSFVLLANSRLLIADDGTFDPSRPSAQDKPAAGKPVDPTVQPLVPLVPEKPLVNGDKYKPDWSSIDTRALPKWFNEAKFGIFICWGPYSVPAWAPKGQYAEWYWNRARSGKKPFAEYHEKVYGKDFDGTRFGPMLKGQLFDADQWADLIARSGAKYTAFTVNYHDGFAMYPTRYAVTTDSQGNEVRPWNAAETGPKRDVAGELSAALQKKGVRFGMYYSLYEWYHPLWLKDRDRYVSEHFHPKFKEVVTRYRPWFIFLDGEWSMDYKKWRSEELAAWLYNESPVADYVVVNDRWGKCRSQHGDIYSSEYGGGNRSPDHPWQEDRGMGRSYGYNRNEDIQDYDSPAELVKMLTRCAGNGGNLLLNIGPSADGKIPVIMQERLLQVGKWLSVNGQSIYGTTASPFWPVKFDWGTVTAKPKKLYLHVWQAGPKDSILRLPGLTNGVNSAYMLADARKRPLEVKKEGADTVITLPGRLPDPLCSVVVLELDGPARVEKKKQG